MKKYKILSDKLLFILEKRELKKLAFLFVATLLMAFLEVLGIASVMPFMSMVVQPSVMHENKWLRWAYEAFDFQSETSFLLATGVAVLFLFIGSNAFSAFARWLQYRFSWDSAHALSMRLLKKYAFSPYSFFLTHHSSDLGKQVLAEVNEFTISWLYPATEVCARFVFAIAIFSLLLYVNPLIAITVIGILSGIYALIYFGFRVYLEKIGRLRVGTIQQRFRLANELLAGIKNIKILGCEVYFLNRFVSASKTYSTIQAKFLTIGNAPRYLVEMIAFGGIIAVILFLLAMGDGWQDVMPLLSLYVLAGYRLLPSLQKMYSAFTSVRYHYPVINEIYRDLKEPKVLSVPLQSGVPSALLFTNEITLQDVSFRYPGTDEFVLRNTNLSIRKGTSVAFAGATGSGKTTLADIIMGLLEPDEGQVLVDGVPITLDNVRQWRSIVGYVPQDVFLFDDTIARNIALGLDDKDIEMDGVMRAAKIANVHAFIEEELPKGYGTVIGERGIRLSGGQRQRLGLARALYREPKVLILDEATSALDGITEEAVMRAINELPYSVTTIMIAHRLATVKNCDYIYLLENGRIVDWGTYDELAKANTRFREMVRLTS